MHADKATPETFLPADVAGPKLGIPIAWLRREAEAGRIPHLKIGRRILFSVQAVSAALVERSRDDRREVARG